MVLDVVQDTYVLLNLQLVSTLFFFFRNSFTGQLKCCCNVYNAWRFASHCQVPPAAKSRVILDCRMDLRRLLCMIKGQAPSTAQDIEQTRKNVYGWLWMAIVPLLLIAKLKRS